MKTYEWVICTKAPDCGYFEVGKHYYVEQCLLEGKIAYRKSGKNIVGGTSTFTVPQSFFVSRKQNRKQKINKLL